MDEHGSKACGAVFFGAVLVGGSACMVAYSIANKDYVVPGVFVLIMAWGFFSGKALEVL